MTYSTAQLVALIGRDIRCVDPRTGQDYKTTITNAQMSYGKLRIQVGSSALYFEPTARELESAQNSGEVEG